MVVAFGRGSGIQAWWWCRESIVNEKIERKGMGCG